MTAKPTEGMQKALISSGEMAPLRLVSGVKTNRVTLGGCENRLSACRLNTYAVHQKCGAVFS